MLYVLLFVLMQLPYKYAYLSSVLVLWVKVRSACTPPCTTTVRSKLLVFSLSASVTGYGLLFVMPILCYLGSDATLNMVLFVLIPCISTGIVYFLYYPFAARL